MTTMHGLFEVISVNDADSDKHGNRLFSMVVKNQSFDGQYTKSTVYVNAPVAVDAARKLNLKPGDLVLVSGTYSDELKGGFLARRISNANIEPIR